MSEWPKLEVMESTPDCYRLVAPDDTFEFDGQDCWQHYFITCKQYDMSTAATRSCCPTTNNTREFVL